MEENFLVLLNEAGLGRNEARVYIALLKQTEASAAELAQKTGLYRPYVYDTLRTLIQKGLVSHITKSGKRFFIPAHPQKILSTLNEKTENLKRIMPNLEELYKSRSENYAIEVFEGKEGLKAIYEQGLKEVMCGKIKEYYAFSITPKSKVLLKYYLPSLMRKAMASSLIGKVDIRTLANYNLKNKNFYIKDYIGDKAVRYLPKNIRLDAQLAVAGDKIILHSNKDRTFFIRVQNREIAESFKKLFRFLWDCCEEKKKRKNI